MYSTTVRADSKEIKLFQNSLIEKIHAANNGQLHVAYRSTIDSLYLIDIKRILIETPALGVAIELKKILLEMIIANDNHIAGSGLISLLVYLEIYSKKYNNVRVSGDLSLALMNLARRSTTEDCHDILLNLTSDQLVTNLVIEASKLAGCDGQISINKDSHYSQTTIELSLGHNLNHTIIENFWLMIKKNKIISDTPSVLVIDGIIESVGEIHHILEEYSKNKETLFIFARGFADDVISTLATNTIRKTLKVYPVGIPINEYSVNVLNDIAVMCLTDVVSSIKGELISAIEIETIVKVDQVILEPALIMIKNKKANIDTARHKKYLLNKRNQMSEGSDMFDIISKRARSMACMVAEITLNKHVLNTGINIDRLDLAIRIFKDLCTHGKINLNQLSVKNNQLQLIIDYLKALDLNILPVRMLISGIVFGATQHTLLANTGLYVVDH